MVRGRQIMAWEERVTESLVVGVGRGKKSQGREREVVSLGGAKFRGREGGLRDWHWINIYRLLGIRRGNYGEGREEEGRQL